MRRILLLFITLVCIQLEGWSQRPALSKMSPWVRTLCPSALNASQSAQSTYKDSQRSILRSAQSDALLANNSPLSTTKALCAFVRTTDTSVLQQYGCRNLLTLDDISIASIPLDRLGALSLDDRVLRIEARPMGLTQMDSVVLQIGARPVIEGQQLPQAFTGKGVVVGVMDIGFDLTHPTFYDSTATHYRIRRLWDFLSVDTVGSQLYVGRDYTTTDELLTLGHSRDGLDQTHGTHTLGTAAGSGYDSPYRGIAPESDICLVANAVSNNAGLIDSALHYKFTFATDALGFKYIFDYATSQQQPCVISFSEGSGQDFLGYDQLYYEMLDKLTGPGRIIVASAGNQGGQKSWFRKPRGQQSAGTFFMGAVQQLICMLKSPDDFHVRINTYTPDTPPLIIDSRDVTAQPDSTLVFHHVGDADSLEVRAYVSSYNPDELCIDLAFYAQKNVGVEIPLSIEVMDADANVEFWRYNGMLYTNADLDASLDAGEPTHNILSPSSSPGVICVGSTMYRQGVFNYQGEWKHHEVGGNGLRSSFSSVGPTADGRIKPDCVAPGTNIISSYSSYYLEQHPDAYDITWDVAHFPFRGRTYAWNSNSGTSMSCPAAAGVIALWLQAVPTLTPQQVLDVLAHTCTQPDLTLTYPNNEYGYGQIDAYRGLLYLLGLDGIEQLSKTHTQLKVWYTNHRLFIGPSPSTATLRLYNLSGRQLWTTVIPASSQQQSLSLPVLAPGIYALQIEGATTGSTLIRI